MKMIVGRKTLRGSKWLKTERSLITQFGWSSGSRFYEHGRKPRDAALHNQKGNQAKKGI
jgi:hypothetical protein